MTITREQLQRSVKNNKLVLSNRGLTNVDIKPIYTFLKEHPGITSLDVSANRIGVEGVEALAANTSLTSLEMRENRIDDEGAIALAANTSLTYLDLSFNRIHDKGAKALVANTSLTSLYVSENLIDDDSDRAIRLMLIRNEQIRRQLPRGQDGKPIKINPGTDAITYKQQPQSLKENELDLPNKVLTDKDIESIGMMVLGGFISAVGIAAVAIAFTVLNAATCGVAGLIMAGVGVAATLSGIGLFASTASKQAQASEEDSLDCTANSFC